MTKDIPAVIEKGSDEKYRILAAKDDEQDNLNKALIDMAELVQKISEENLELKRKMHIMKCCRNCKYNNLAGLMHGCDGNCVIIDGKDTWQDWELNEDE